MRNFLKIIVVLVIIIILGVGVFFIYLTQFLPDIDVPEDLQVELTTERIERGNYLADQVMGCTGCHAIRDYTRFAGPIVKETKGSGGELWDEKLRFPGILYAPNITPSALKDWTDGQLFSAITSGIDNMGNALFPIMPYHQYGQLPKEDIYAVIAYIRTLKPIDIKYPDRELSFPLSIMINTIPKTGTHHLKPDLKNPVKHGEYMITAAACYDCHTLMNDRGRFIEKLGFAGGMEFPMVTGGTVRAANITPDKETGIGNWTKEMFVERFKIYADSSYVLPVVKPNDFNTYMPWEYYAQLKVNDLEAIYWYLMSLDPIQHKVIKFTPGK